MVHEVVVVGGGIGGLTVAALLAARGVDVCLLERSSSPGGCIAAVEKFGYTFDPGVGIYPLWQKGEIHDQVFSELPVDPPEVRPHDPAYVVRLPDQIDVPLSANLEEFEAALHTTFPECANKAVAFYRESARLTETLKRAFQKVPDLLTAGRVKQIRAAYPHLLTAARIRRARNDTALQHLEGASLRFRRFVDVQLQLIAQATSQRCPYLHAALALTIPRQGTYSIRGGAAALAERLADSIKRSGGRLRFDAPVLRLAYDTNGRAVGVNLLSGETVTASRAIVSNLTVWDTYGKLFGLNRTPPEIRKLLSGLKGWGAYVLYLGMNENAASRLPGNHILTLEDWQEDQEFDPETAEFILASAPAWDRRAPEGKRAVTVLTFTDVEEWFTFHESEEQVVQKDQSALEALWERLHRAIPELGEDVEPIETATPLSVYDITRRKLGMLGSASLSATFGLSGMDCSTSMSNVFMVGDTTFPGGGIAGVTCGALALANRLTA